MTLTDKRKALIDKIMKLLAKAESTQFLEEAESARKLAAEGFEAGKSAQLNKGINGTTTANSTILIG